MIDRSSKWTAVVSGMASSASLYGEPQSYMAFARRHPVGQAFAAVGLHLSDAAGEFEHDNAATGSPERLKRSGER